MKKISFLFVLVLGILLSSCLNSNTPEVVAEKFLTAMENQNYAEAKKFCDEKTAQIVDMVAGIPMPKQDKKTAKKVIIKRVEENKEDKNKAKVFYIVEGEKGKGKEAEQKETSIDVTKIDGKWKVTLNKENKEQNHNHQDEEENMHDHEGHDHDSLDTAEEVTE